MNIAITSRIVFLSGNEAAVRLHSCDNLLAEPEERKLQMFADALRGYAFETMKRDGFKCRYCGLDGRESFSNWLALSEDHLLPKGHARRNDREFIVCACSFCNSADNRYFDKAAERGLQFEGMTPEDLVEQRRSYVERTRESYRIFWEGHVKANNP